MTTTLWIILGVLGLAVLWLIAAYNGLVICASAASRRSLTSTCN